MIFFFFFQAEDGIRDVAVTGVQTCALPICGGGGVSNTFGKPSWQSGPGTQSGNREVPDVSADADPATGYATYCTVTNAGCPSTGWITVGGTSAAAPLWAGSMALIDQYLQSQGKAVV